MNSKTEVNWVVKPDENKLSQRRTNNCKQKLRSAAYNEAQTHIGSKSLSQTNLWFREPSNTLGALSLLATSTHLEGSVPLELSGERRIETVVSFTLRNDEVGEEGVWEGLRDVLL